MTDVTDIPHLPRTPPPAQEPVAASGTAETPQTAAIPQTAGTAHAAGTPRMAGTLSPALNPARDAGPLSIRPIPALQDNYIWCIGRGRDFIVVDPGEAQPVLNALMPATAAATRPDDAAAPRAGTTAPRTKAVPPRTEAAPHQANAGPGPARLLAILITHHHHDHVGGIAGLLAQWPDARVIGPAHCVPLGVKESVGNGDTLHFPALDLDLQVMATPGHTQDHLSYFCPPLPGHPHPALFCGDTLFSAGCGRVFDGTVAQLFQSLQQLRTLPPDTRICAAHEYTLTNLHFALGAEPGNDAIRERLAHCRQLREDGLPTLPSTLSGELQVNPFLRAHLPALSRHLPADLQPETADAFGVFAALRRWRNGFKPPATP